MGNFSKLLPSDTLPKWQVALIVTVPVAFGLGYLYYKFNLTNRPIVVAKTVETKKIETVPAKETVTKPLTKAEQALQLKSKGNELFKEGKYKEAVQYYTEAINICPAEEKDLISTLYQNRAASYEKLDDVNMVVKDCTESLLLNKRYSKALMRRAKANEKLQNLYLALEDVSAVCLIENYSNQESIRELDRISKATATRDTEKYITDHEPKLPSRFFIRTYLSTYQHGSALSKVDKENSSTMELLKKYRSIEELLLSGNNIEKSCEMLLLECEQKEEQILRIETLMLRATFYILSKQNEKAFADLDKVIADPDVDIGVKINALIKRGTLHQHQGEEKKREEDFQKAIDIDENNPDIYHHLGQIYLITDNISESVNNFRKAVALDPEFPVTVVQHNYAEYRYAVNFNKIDAMHHHLNEFKNIISRFPNNMECITLYAQVLTERQEYTQSEQLFDEAIKREPTHAALLVHKALLLLQWKADINEAKNLINKALEMDKDCEFAYETMATIEMQLGNMKEAVEHFNQAIKQFSSKEELFHLFCLRNAAEAQYKVEQRIGKPNLPANYDFFGYPGQ